jgi:capsule polysaccharide export protein KpsC/LpsZ
VYSWGNGYYIKPLVTQGDAIQTYGANLMAVSMTTSGIMSLLSADYEGAWELDIALTFKNTNANSPRANPYIEIHKNNAYSKRFSTSAQYSRCTQAMHATLNIKGVDLIESTDTFKIVTKITTGSEQSYGTTVVTDWIGTNLAITWKYLGVMGEYTHAITS